MKRYFSYSRVSTKNQGDGVSLPEQRSFMQGFADYRKLYISEWFEGMETAKKEGRKVFNEMMKRLKKGEADGVIFHKIDRSMRNRHDWAEINKLIDKGIEVYFVQENLDLNTPTGRYMADIIAAGSTHYSVNLSYEVNKGIRGNLKIGNYPFQAPVGYMNMGKADKPKEPDPVQGPLARKVFELYATKQHTVVTLADKMHKLGLRNTRGAIMRPNDIHKMLRNPFYMGIMKVKGKCYEGRHIPIIQASLFKKVQDILDGKTHQKGIKYAYPYRKAITCGFCGYSLVGEKQKGNVYYRCHTKSCPMKTIREDAVSAILSKAFALVEFYPVELKHLSELLDEFRNDWVNKKEDLLVSIKFQREVIQNRLHRLTDLLVDETIDKHIYDQKRNSILIESQEVKQREDEITNEKEVILTRVENFLELCKSLIKSYKLTNPDKISRLLKIVTSNLSAKGKNLEITMASPFYEAYDKRKYPFSGPNRDTPRTNKPLIFSLQVPTQSKSPPLSKKQLQEYLQYLMDNTEILEVESNDKDSK